MEMNKIYNWLQLPILQMIDILLIGGDCMQNYEVSKNALVNYVKTKSDISVKELEYFIRFHASGLIFDYNKLRFDYLNFETMETVNLILSMNIVKANVEKYRPRDKNPHNPAYEIYLSKFKNHIQKNKLPQLSEDTFFEIYNAFNQISLNNLKEINYGSDIFNVFNFLKSNLSNDDIVEFLTNLFIQKASFLNHLIDHFDDTFCVEFNKMFKKIVRKYSLSDFCVNLFCLLEQEQHYDFALEDNHIFYEFTFCFNKNNYEGSILFEPTLLFIRKWISDDALNDVELFLVFTDGKKYKFVQQYCEKYSNIHVLNFNAFKNQISEFELNYYVLFFGNHFKDDGLKQYCLITIAGFFCFEKLMIYDLDSNINEYTSINEIYNLNQIQLFPQRKYDKKQIKRSMLFEYDGKAIDDNPITVIHFSLIKEGQYPSLSPKVFENKMDQSGLNDSNIKLRTIYKNAFVQSQKLSNQVRNVAQPFQFSKEITIFYRSSFDSIHNNFRVGAYIVDDDKMKMDSTVKNCRLKSEKEIVGWVNTIYPYEKVKKKNANISIWKEISKFYKDKYNNKPLTLKSFVYLYRNKILSKFGESQIVELNKLSEGVLGLTYLENISSLVVNDELDAVYGDQVIKKHGVKALLSNVIDMGVEFNHAQKNQIRQEVKDERNYCDRMFYQSRDHLTIKYFSTKENKKIYNYLKKHIHDSSLHLATYIKLVTGLESNIVCGLQWKDFVPLQDYNGNNKTYQLIIRKQLLNDGSKFSDFKYREYYRKIPCNDELTNILLEARASFMKITNISDEKLINEVAIIDGEDNRIDGGIGVISPQHLTRFSNSIVKKIRKNFSLTAYIPDSKKGTIETDFLNYGGDIFKSNFQHYGLYAAKFNEGELDYLQGRKSATPFARNYCDYGNDASQLILKMKQDRFMQIFKKKEVEYAKQVELHGERDYYSVGKKDYLSELIFQIDTSDELHIHVESNYGVDVDFTPIEGENNEYSKK